MDLVAPFAFTLFSVAISESSWWQLGYHTTVENVPKVVFNSDQKMALPALNAVIYL